MSSKFQKHIFICTNERPKDNPRGDCIRCGAMEIRTQFVKLINKHGLKGKVRANKSGCMDVCELGAVVVIYPDNIWYTQVKIEDVDEIFHKSILEDSTVNRLSADDRTWQKLKKVRGSIK